MLKVFADEDNAERLAQMGSVDKAVDTLQGILDKKYVTSATDRGWYLQEMARYRYADSKTQSNELQLQAHKLNRNLLKPRDGLVIAKIVAVSQKRMSKIITWIQGFESYNELNATVLALLDHLQFGVEADLFERALDVLGVALGFETQRPDNDWGEGPDNLWALRTGDYILWECKSAVETTRDAIHKKETGQIANASAWFAKHYVGASVRRIIIIPTNVLGKGAGFTEPVEVMRMGDLKSFTGAVKTFFKEFRTIELKSLSENAVQKLINQHGLSTDDMFTNYAKKPKEA